MRLRRTIARGLNTLLAPARLQLVRTPIPTVGGRPMSDEDVIREARRLGLSVGDYLEQLFGRTGRAAGIIARMRDLGAIPDDLQSVCEIGAGSGMYVERVLKLATPTLYEVYEIEANRARFLAAEYPIVVQPTDGETLRSTESGSMQLVHSHGVFVALAFLTSVSYFREIQRVTAPGGYAVFDILCEDCLDGPTVDDWLASNLRYPSMLAKSYVVDLFERQGFRLVDDFREPLLVLGDARYLVFQKSLDPAQRNPSAVHHPSQPGSS